MKTERAEVYAAIDSERAYQDKIWPGQVGPKEHDLDAFALYVAGYTAKLVEVCSTTDDSAKRLDFFRKVAGICVAAMEQHGAPKRVMS